LGSGLCRVTDLVGAGAPVGLGVDGVASNEVGGLFPELLQSLYTGRQRTGPPADFIPAAALPRASEGGAACLGRDAIGRLDPGYRADLVVWPGDDLGDVPDPLAGLVLGPDRQARPVLVEGPPGARGGDPARGGHRGAPGGAGPPGTTGVAGVTGPTMVEHSLPYEVNCSILFTELPLLERPAAAKEAGFDAVESWWPFAVAVPADGEVEAFVRAAGDAGVRLVGLNFFAGDMPGGDRGLVSWPARSAEFRDNVEVTIGIGERLGCRAFNALYGNRVDDADPAAQDELATENLALAGRAAARIGGTVLVEPVSGADRSPPRAAPG